MTTAQNLKHRVENGAVDYLSLAVLRREGELPVVEASPLVVTARPATEYEYEVTDPYELPLERNEGVRPGSCCRGAETVEDLCLECHLAVFA